MDSRVRELIKISDGLFAKRGNLLNLWQEQAEHFYPERADFTVKRFLGDGNETGLMTSTPVLARRELGNMISTVLRPDGISWNNLTVEDEATNLQHDNRAWLEWATKVQRKAMYDTIANFGRATKECDHDWVTFGQGVMSTEVNMAETALLYRTWHLRDCAWSDGYTGKTDRMNRKWKPSIRQLYQKFPKTISPKLLDRMKQDPDQEIHCQHIVCPREDYDTSVQRKTSPQAKWMSFYIDIENEDILESTPMNWFMYNVPKWSTLSGSQYAWSPATGPGLADARTLQAMTRVLLEAGEKSVDPAMIATQEAVRSDIDIRPGGVTWVDVEYDEKLGEALRSLNQNINIPVGIELVDRMKRVVDDGFFLNKINLPADVDLGKMTAYATQKRIQESLRSVTPIFAPAIQDYNMPICELSFEILMSLKTFGPPENMPQGLRGKEVRFTFSSPLTDMIDEGNAQKFIQGAQILQVGTQIDPAQIAAINIDKAMPAALKGVGFPEDWMGDEKAVPAMRDQQAKEKTAQQGMGALAGGATAAKDAATAAATLQDAGLLG